MAGKVNYKLLTFQKLVKEVGIDKDKDILTLTIEDLGKIKNFTSTDLKNVIELRKKIKSEGLVGYFKESENTTEQTKEIDKS